MCQVTAIADIAACCDVKIPDRVAYRSLEHREEMRPSFTISVPVKLGTWGPNDVEYE